MTIALIYPYLPTEDDGADLRLSLRSVETFLHIGDIHPIVVGTSAPAWLDPKHFVEFTGVSPDPAFRVQNVVLNMARGLHEAAMVEGLSDDFLYMNDDFVLMEPREDVLALHGRAWQVSFENRNRTPLSWVRAATEATHRWIHHLPGPLWSWETHVPMWMKRSRALPLFERLMMESPRNCPFPRSTYGGLVGYDTLRTYYADDALLEPGVTGSSWVAFNEFAAKGFRQTAEKRLATPSRWEQ